MPTAAQEAAPSISQIYSCFDDDSYRVFRRAMTHSRGGVVRVEDILAALAEALPERTGAILGLDTAAVARLARPPAMGPDLLPMANEPALRLVLADAHGRARGGPITPALVLQAVAGTRPPAPCPVARSAPPAPHLPLTAEAVQTVLHRWLEAQSWPGDLRDRALQQVASLLPLG